MYNRIASMDISKNSIGLVFSDEDCQFVAYEYHLSPRKDKDLLQQLFLKHKPVHTYIGLPCNLNGSSTNNTNFVKSFVHNNRHILKPFTFLDEHKTTSFGEYLISVNGPKQIDVVSARILLNSAMLLQNKQREN